MGITVTGGVKLPQGKFSVTSNRAPTWTTSAGAIPSEDAGTVVSFQFEASDPEQGTSGLTFSKNSGDFPAGLSMDSAGLLTGTASAVESDTQSDFNLRVTDAGGLFADEDFTMTINFVFSVNSVHFNGTNTYLTRGGLMTGLTDTNKYLCSFWYRRTRNDPAAKLLFIPREDKLVPRFEILLTGNGNISLIGINSSGTGLLSAGTSAAPFTLNVWKHCLISVDVSIARVDLYVNDVSVNWAAVTTTNGSINYATNDFGVGAGWAAGNPGNSKTDGDVAEMWWHHNLSLDLTTTSNRRKFIDANGKPVDLGSDGSATTGTIPIVFLSGATSSWHTNKGSGGGFNETGALTDGTGPVET